MHARRARYFLARLTGCTTISKIRLLTPVPKPSERAYSGGCAMNCDPTLPTSPAMAHDSKLYPGSTGAAEAAFSDQHLWHPLFHCAVVRLNASTGKNVVKSRFLLCFGRSITAVLTVWLTRRFCHRLRSNTSDR